LKKEIDFYKEKAKSIEMSLTKYDDFAATQTQNLFNTAKSPRLVSKQKQSRSITPIRPRMSTDIKGSNNNLKEVIERMSKLVAITQKPQTLEENEKRIIIEKYKKLLFTKDYGTIIVEMNKLNNYSRETIDIFDQIQ